MPTILFLYGFRFFFYSNESNEPCHIHITKGNANGKIWIEPVLGIAYLHGFTNAEEKQIIEIVEANYELFKIKWHEYFKK